MALFGLSKLVLSSMTALWRLCWSVSQRTFYKT